MKPQPQPTPPRITLGRHGEDVAADYLEGIGLAVVERNWRCEHGEIDLVALDRDCLVICEVKTRRGTAFGEPVEAITRAKLARLRRLATLYAATEGVAHRRVRLDVVGVLIRGRGPAHVRHVVAVGS